MILNGGQATFPDLDFISLITITISPAFLKNLPNGSVISSKVHKSPEKKYCNIFHILKDICRETMEKKLNHYSCTCECVYSTEIFLLLHELICWLQHPEFALMGFSSKLHEIPYMHAEFFFGAHGDCLAIVLDDFFDIWLAYQLLVLFLVFTVFPLYLWKIIRSTANCVL